MAKKDKLKSKKLGFLRKQKEKLDKKRRDRKNSLKKVISPMKQLRNLSADKIKEYLEDSPLLQAETELADFSFNEELVTRYTNSSLENFAEQFKRAATKSIARKRQLYEDFCMETTVKLVGKAFLVSLQRRLRMAAKRLKEEGRTTEMMRAIVCEATLNIPQIPVEAHPLIVGMYEDVRLKAMGDSFTIDGFEDVLYWKRRVEIEREEAKTVSYSFTDKTAVVDFLTGNERFTAVDSPEKNMFSMLIEDEDTTPDASTESAQSRSVTVLDDTLVFKGNSSDDADEARRFFLEHGSDLLTEIQPGEDDDDDEGPDDAPLDEESESTEEQVTAPESDEKSE